MKDKKFIELQRKLQRKMDELELLQQLYKSQTHRRFVDGQPIRAPKAQEGQAVTNRIPSA